MRFAGIYLLRNLINGMIYIGKSIEIRRRIYSHKHSVNARKCLSYLDRAIRKYGWENFEVLLVEKVDDVSLLLEKEAGWIRYYNSTNPKIGYNLCEYSNDFTGHHHSEETKLKLSKLNTGKMMGEKNFMFGKTHSTETRQKISDKVKGRFGKKNPFYGKKHKKSSLLQAARTRREKGLWKKGREIYQIDKNTGAIIKKWKNSAEAAMGLFGNKKRKTNIYACCRGWIDCGISFGYKWEFV